MVEDAEWKVQPLIYVCLMVVSVIVCFIVEFLCDFHTWARIKPQVLRPWESGTTEFQTVLPFYLLIFVFVCG